MHSLRVVPRPKFYGGEMEVGQDLELIWVNNMTKYIGQYSQKLKNIFIGKLSV